MHDTQTHVDPSTDALIPGEFRGLRMTADEFLELPDDGCNYELIDGIVVMSPSPEPIHQSVAWEIATQLGIFLRDHPIGEAFSEIDVHLGALPVEGSPKTRGGEELVYKPEIIFVRKERLPPMRKKIIGGPDLVVEVISRGSRRLDSLTKKLDYETYGVREYWLIDPQRKAMTFYRLRNGKFEEITLDQDVFRSEAVPGFTLDLARVRRKFKPW